MKIREFKVYGFWGKYDVRWEMKSNVNVLVGINGLGKSSLLKLLAYCLNPEDDSKVAWEEVAKLAEEVEIIFVNGGVIRVDLHNYMIDDAKNVRQFINMDWADLQIITNEVPLIVKTFDNADSLDKILGLRNNEGFFSALIGHFFNYRNEKIATVLDNGGNLAEESRDIYNLYDVIDKYFGDSNKRINRSFRTKEFLFEPTNIGVDKLSSGEKQLLVLFLATFLQRQQETFLLLDEPETSLHTLWQENLFSDLLAINPNCQLIVVTHATSTFGYDWVSNRVRINEIIFPIGTLLQENKQEMENSFQQNYPALVQNVINFIDTQIQNTNAYQVTYEINVLLKNIDVISLQHAGEIVRRMNNKGIKVDVITITTLINRVFSTVEEAKQLLQIGNVEPNDYAFNSLLKKANSVENGVQFIAEFIALYNYIKPDIFTFSTLLGKAKNAEEVRLVEDQRMYYNVKANEIYNSKLHFKLAK